MWTGCDHTGHMGISPAEPDHSKDWKVWAKKSTLGSQTLPFEVVWACCSSHLDGNIRWARSVPQRNSHPLSGWLLLGSAHKGNGASGCFPCAISGHQIAASPKGCCLIAAREKQNISLHLLSSNFTCQSIAYHTGWIIEFCVWWFFINIKRIIASQENKMLETILMCCGPVKGPLLWRPKVPSSIPNYS